jgi:hypothetical protein
MFQVFDCKYDFDPSTDGDELFAVINRNSTTCYVFTSFAFFFFFISFTNKKKPFVVHADACELHETTL